MRDKDHAYTSGAVWRSFTIECAGMRMSTRPMRILRCIQALAAYLGCLVGILDRGKRTDILVCESGVTGAEIWCVF